MKKLINHVALVIDDSPSMQGLLAKTREVVREQIKGFQSTSKLKNQTTLLSIYTFGGTCANILFDADPKFAPKGNFLHANNSATAVRDATKRAIDDLGEISTKSGDHSFLIYVITDGEDNASVVDAGELKDLIVGLNDDWTIASLVPNAIALHAAKTCGLPKGNIEIWETTERGMEEVGSTICSSYTAYASARSLGQKSTKTLFQFQPVTKTEVVKKLEEVGSGDYETLIVRPYHNDWPIKEFVESLTKKPYRVGSAYFQVTKPEKIGAGKTVAVIEKSTGKMFSGVKARSLLGLPNHEVKVEPADFKLFDLFVQSTSTNRKLVADTHLVVFK